LSVSICISVSAATIKGTIIDKETGEPIVGAVIILENTKFGAATGLDGKYVIHNVPAGTYKLKIEYPSYEKYEKDVTLTEGQTVTLDSKIGANTHELKEVHIAGKYLKGSDEESQSREKNAKEIMNIMSARTIELSPDITVASVLQRVSGVSTESSNSGRQYAIIRGMDKKYNTTLVNGVKIPSPNDRDRYVPVDIFPAELLERLEVVKTLSPSMEGDATGGVVNMVMKNAPDKFEFDANFAVGYSAIFESQDFLKYNSSTVKWQAPSQLLPPGGYASVANFPINNLLTTPISNPLNTNYGFTIGNRYLKSKLGVVVSGSYQNTYKGYNSASYLPSTTEPPAASKNAPMIQTFSDLNYREISTLSQRLGLMTRVDYELSDKTSLSLFATAIALDEYRTRFTGDSTLGGSSLNTGYTGYAGNKTQIETRTTLQNIYNVTLQGKHKFASNFSGDLSLVASQAKEQMPDDATWAFTSKDSIDQNRNLIIGPPKVDNMHRQWLSNVDNDLATYLNLHYSPSFLRGLKLIEVGGLYRHKTRDNFHKDYKLTPNSTDPGQNDQPYTSLQNAQYVLLTAYDAQGTTHDPGIYTYTEDIVAAYIQLDYDVTSKLDLFGGVRMETTDGGYVSQLQASFPGASANYVYTDVLPSLQAKYTLNEKSAIRAAYFTSIYRPAYGDLVPFSNNTVYDDYSYVGNPYVQHTVVQNFDVRYELFPNSVTQFMVGAFSKILQNPIENTLDSVGIQPLNYGTAYNNGFELVLRRYFGNFGISGNYTFTNSQITTGKEIYYIGYDSVKKMTTSYTGTVNQTRPLVGQAANIGNISLLYKNPKSKINAQVAFVYTGERINFVSPYLNLDVWQKPVLTLDFSAEKGFGKHFTVYVKANNLLNSGFELFIKQPNQAAYSGAYRLRYQDSPNYVTVQKDFYKSTYLLGFKYKF